MPWAELIRCLGNPQLGLSALSTPHLWQVLEWLAQVRARGHRILATRGDGATLAPAEADRPIEAGEVSRLLNIGRSTLYKHCHEFPYVVLRWDPRSTDSLLFSRDRVLLYLEARGLPNGQMPEAHGGGREGSPRPRRQDHAAELRRRKITTPQ